MALQSRELEEKLCKRSKEAAEGVISAKRNLHVCHVCAAGQRGVPWEGYPANGLASWWPTCHTQDPFDGQPALNKIPFIPGQRASFYAWDLFHAYHLGVGKSLVAGCLAMASDYMLAGKLDERLEQLSHMWLSWCAENHLPTYLYSLSSSILGWPDRSTFPNGQWSKGHITTNLGKFFESWASEQDLEDDEIMALALQTCKNVSRCFTRMYSCDVFLCREDAEVVATAGQAFLHGYRQLATKCFRAGKALFPLMPKGHSLDHIFCELRADLANSGIEFFLNPLNHAVQISEDWVGRTSRISRRTGPPQAILRTWQRVLEAAYARWHKEGLITW